MTNGLKVAGGDRLGKTIIFAKNQAHADFIADRFNVNYPHYKGEFARVITFKTEYAQSLIDDFSIKDKAPHIAISVDMRDTGIDVPEVVNLVFFKIVQSLVGLDREAAKNAFAEFLSGKAMSSSQIEFLNMIIDHLAEHGLLDPAQLYESPFTDVTPQGPEGLFGSEQVDRLIQILASVRQTATAA